MGLDKFTWIKTILADGQIPDGERLVLVGTAIWFVRYGEDEFCVRQTTIAERMAVSVVTVKRAMKRAKHIGYIQLAQPRQRGSGHHKADGHRLALPPEIGSNLTPIDAEIGVTDDRNRYQDRQEKVSISPEIGISATSPTSGNDDPKGLEKGLEKGGGEGCGSAAPPPPPLAEVGQPVNHDDVSHPETWSEWLANFNEVANPEDVVPADKPSRFCDRHQPDGTPDPCHACRWARTKHEKWVYERAEWTQWNNDLRAEIRECRRCDARGQYTTDEGLRWCEHSGGTT
jgi:hypothetical protein